MSAGPHGMPTLPAQSDACARPRSCMSGSTGRPQRCIDVADDAPLLASPRARASLARLGVLGPAACAGVAAHACCARQHAELIAFTDGRAVGRFIDRFHLELNAEGGAALALLSLNTERSPLNLCTKPARSETAWTFPVVPASIERSSCANNRF